MLILKEAIFQCLFAFTDESDEVLLVTPCFDAAVRSASTLGVRLRGVSLVPGEGGAGSWKLDMEQLEAKLTAPRAANGSLKLRMAS